MTNLAWKDVAHHYTHSLLFARVMHNGAISGISGYANSGAYVGDEFLFWGEFKPILRALDDISEAEMLAVLDIRWKDLEIGQKPIVLRPMYDPKSMHGQAITYKTQHYIYDNGQPYEKSGAMKIDWLGFECFHWLLYQGFDLFGLIDRGEAERRK